MVWKLGYHYYRRFGYHEALDGDLHAIRLRDETPELGLLTTPGYSAAQTGRQIRSDHLPTKIKVAWGRRGITDFGQLDSLSFVSDAFKQIVEELEPDTHQFFPVELFNPGGKHIGNHWIWNVCNRIDSVDREHTTLVLHRGIIWIPASDLAADKRPPDADLSRQPKLVFNLDQIGDAHFWRDKYLPTPGLYCSEEARLAMADAELSGVQLTAKEAV